MESILLKVLEKYNIPLESNQKYVTQNGIVDLLIYCALQKQNKIGKIYVNIEHIMNYSNNPENALEFKIQLLLDIGCNFGITKNLNHLDAEPNLPSIIFSHLDLKQIPDFMYLFVSDPERMKLMSDIRDFRFCPPVRISGVSGYKYKKLKLDWQSRFEKPI